MWNKVLATWAMLKSSVATETEEDNRAVLPWGWGSNLDHQGRYYGLNIMMWSRRSSAEWRKMKEIGAGRRQ